MSLSVAREQVKRAKRTRERGAGVRNVAVDLAMELHAHYQGEIDHNLFIVRALLHRNEFLKRRLAENRDITSALERKRAA